MPKATRHSGPDALPNRPTEDEALLEAPSERPDALRHSDPWRILRIMGEFVEGFDSLADVAGAVTIFGSARTSTDDPMYAKAVQLAGRLAVE
jgi:hypothetical protein